MSELKTIKTDEEISPVKIKKNKGCLKHSLYEWLTLLSSLFVPLVVGILTVVLPLQQQNISDHQNENSKAIALNNRLQDLKLLQDQQKQVILNTFEHDLCNLLLKYKTVKIYNDTSSSPRDDDDDDDDNNDIKEDDNDDERISFIIRTKTLHALRQLDPARKILLIQLLIDSGIQKRISISRADLSSLIFPPGSFYNQFRFVNVVARDIKLKNVYLYQSNFSYSILDDSSFYESNCSYADFSHASLQRTDWTNTDVTQAIFNFTNLLGAKITSQQLATVHSLQGAVLPNGSTAII
ncbi:unnamed protein product [Adineta steineri]|uniref:Pentapeptide repeat-containing protein n=1 Tax=Adineta steineri TaxID=433720 RepID=A0A814PKA2_9BILA|nr:unnamed protein product [Adineta steineri]CAF1578807.1 unnamed protein product [Adineta steineri]